MTVVSPQLLDLGSPSREEITVAIDSDQLTLGERSAALPRHESLSGDFATASTRTIDSTRSATIKIRQLFREEFADLHLRLLIARMLLALLPIHVGGRVRTMILRRVGFQIGRGTIMAGMPTITLDGNMYKRLVIGEGCWINIGCLFDLGAEIRIGSRVSIGHGVLVLTRSHDIGPSQQRAFTLHTRPVNIGSGVWLGSRSTILPGVTIGAGAIVAAGSVVHHDVPPNTLVAGVPARVIKVLS
jgi:maltose O-acetyltransferase